ncbi:MAG TPA: M1 family metallopeptidase [Chitinophagaceae bacterium]
MKKTIFFLLLAQSLWLAASSQYWQQQANYTIDVSLDDKNHTLKGSLTLEYTNNSPDKLDYIWFHLWPNAYKNETTAYAKQIFRDADGKKRWKEMKDKGFIDSLDFTVNGEKAKTEIDKDNIDIMKLFLPKPLQPGGKTTIKTPFFVKIPTYSSRSGHIDQSYMICQWYPKPAVYDRKGWHPIPYLDQGEFYSEFGSFDVKITVPSSYVIGATGTLQNTAELNKYKEIGKANNEGKIIKYTSTISTPLKTLEYKGDNIHDFAWFADKDFVVRYDTAQLSPGKTIDVFTYGYEDGNKNWKKSVSYVENAIRSYSNWIGEYPYPVAQAVEGPKNVMSGGMEYPMITLITSPNAAEPELDGVIAHEVGHNWFYGILASNERDHAWMDEGMNTYFQFRYEAEKYKANSIFGNMLPAEIKAKPLPEFFSAIYGAMSQIPMEEAIETPSADFNNKEQYGVVVYLKTALWMYIVSLTVGEDKLDTVVKAYFNDWKFKHPYPEDLKAEFEEQLNIKVDDLFGLLNKTGKFE